MPIRTDGRRIGRPTLPQAMRRSLVARVLGIHAFGLIVAAALTLGSLNLLLHFRTRALEHQRLEDQAGDVIGGLRFNKDGQLHIDYGATTLARNGHGPFSFVVREGDGQLRLSSPEAPVSRLSEIDLSPYSRFSVRRDGDVLSTITRPFDLRGHRYWVTVAWNLSAPGVIFENILNGFPSYSTATTLVLLAGLLGVDLLVMRTSLRPLYRVAQAVQRSRRCDEYRLSLHELPREILPMAEAYNDALDRAENSYRRQREFTADAAHELRTPLAVLQARLETLEHGELRGQLLSDVGVMGHIVSQLLQMASLETPVVDASSAADPIAVCGRVVEALAPMAIAARRELGLSIPESTAPTLRIDADELFQVLRNLVENAIHHTGPGVRIDVAVHGDGLLVVSDDGPGIPTELHTKVFERFWRRERQTRSGAGLGLAIVRRLVTRSGGTVELESSPGAGCRFLVRVPPAVPRPNQLPNSGQGLTEKARALRSARPASRADPRQLPSPPGCRDATATAREIPD